MARDFQSQASESPNADCQATVAELKKRLRQQSVVLDRLTLIAKCYIDHQSGMSSESISESLRLLAKSMRSELAFVSVQLKTGGEFIDFSARRTRKSSAAESESNVDRDSAMAQSIWSQLSLRSALQELRPVVLDSETAPEICGELGFRNSVIVPLNNEAQFGGFIGICDYSLSHSAPADIIRYIRLAGEIVHHSVLITRAEQIRREQEALFRKVIDINPNFIFAKDREGRFILVNQAVAEVYGADVSDILGKTDADFNPDTEECEQFINADLEVIETLTEKFVAEERITDTLGRTRFLQTVKRPIVGDDGIARAVLGVSTDITDRKAAEAERETLMLKMQQTQRLESLGVLAGGIAHDFNNLLMGIVGHCDLAASVTDDPVWVADKLRQIRLAAKRATELTNQLLAYSGKGHFVIDEADISELVREICSLLDVVVSKKAKLQFELATRLPKVEVDISQVRQVFMNLITNASDALGDQPGRILVRTEQVQVRESTAFGAVVGQLQFRDELSDGCYVLVQVCDTGIGMDEMTIERIFDPFFTTKFTGRGLGLAAVHGIVRGHRGAILVESKPYCGTTFSVLLPAKESAIKTLPSRIVPTNQHSLQQGIEVLLVDDEPVSLSVMEQMLAFLGHRVVVARDGREAVSKFGNSRTKVGKSKFSMVLLDLTMPEMDGYETWIEILKLDPDVPVVLMSGYCETDVRQRFAESWGRVADETLLEATANRARVPKMIFIQKPFGQGQLKEKLKELGLNRLSAGAQANGQINWEL